MPARTLGPEGGGLEGPTSIVKGMSVSENTGPRRGVDCEIHIDCEGNEC